MLEVKLWGEAGKETRLTLWGRPGPGLHFRHDSRGKARKHVIREVRKRQGSEGRRWNLQPKRLWLLVPRGPHPEWERIWSTASTNKYQPSHQKPYFSKCIQHPQRCEMFAFLWILFLLAFRSENQSRAWINKPKLIHLSQHLAAEVRKRELWFEERSDVGWAKGRPEAVGGLWGLGSGKQTLPYNGVRSCACSLTLGVLCIYSSNTY